MTITEITEHFSAEYHSKATPVLVEDDSSEEKPSSREEPIDITKEVAEEDKHLVRPAGVGGAVLGILCFGPILGTLLGFSAAYAVRRKNGAGDVARALGELTASVQEKTAEIEEKHHFGENTKEAINNFCDDEGERSIPFKTRKVLVTTWLSLAGYTKGNQLLEKGVEGTGKGIEAIGRAFERLQGKSPTSSPNEDLLLVATDVVPVEVSDDCNDDRYTELVPVKTH